MTKVTRRESGAVSTSGEFEFTVGVLWVSCFSIFFLFFVLSSDFLLTVVFICPSGKTDEQTKQHHYTQTNTNNVNKTCILLQTTGGKDEPKIVSII
jgi:hypothetical protein